MRFADLVRVIETTAPLSIAAAWDRSGIQVATRREEISRLAVCLDPLPCHLALALEQGAEMILSHHPLALEPRLPDRTDAYHETLSLLFRADAALYAAHTSLDANPAGPVGWLGRELGLRPLEGAPERAPLQVLEPTGAMTHEGREIACGFGVVGELPAALTPEALARALAPWTTGVAVRLAGRLPEQIRRVAVCPGAGASLAAEAAAYGADVLITGDLKHHQALEAPLPVLDVGHFSLEEEMMRRFAADLDRTLAGVSVCFMPGRDPLRPFFPVAG